MMVKNIKKKYAGCITVEIISEVDKLQLVGADFSYEPVSFEKKVRVFGVLVHTHSATAVSSINADKISPYEKEGKIGFTKK